MLPRGKSKVLAVVVALLCMTSPLVVGWTLGTSASNAAAKRRTMSVKYAPTNMPTTETPEMVAQKMLKCSPPTRSVSADKEYSASLSLSRSAMASSESQASFPTSHGLLSPETVLRMEELIIREGHKSEAVVSFLKTYKQHGPMSCLPMLSDPDILPHLTNAMRESMTY